MNRRAARDAVRACGLGAGHSPSRDSAGRVRHWSCVDPRLRPLRKHAAALMLSTPLVATSSVRADWGTWVIGEDDITSSYDVLLQCAREDFSP